MLHDLEYLQALCLRVDLASYTPALDPRAPYDQIRGALLKLSHAMLLRSAHHVDTDASDVDRHRMKVQERVRIATYALRNFGYEPQVRRLCDDLFDPLADSLFQSIGVRPGSLVTLIDRLIERMEERLNEFRSKLRLMLHAKSIGDVVTAYLSSFPQVTSSADELISYVEEDGDSLEQNKRKLLARTNLELPSIFTFSTQDLAALLDGANSQRTVELAIRTWSMAFGDLAACDPEHLILSNPVWTRPIVRLPDETVFIPCPGTLHGKRIELLEKALLTDRAMRRRYEKRRASYLEERTAELLEQQLPSASIWRGTLWRDPATDTEYENDIVLRIDTHMFIIEAKSGRITDPARRGAPGRLGRTIRDLIQAPSEQASRFEDFLRANDGEIELPNRRGGANRIDLAGVRHFTRLNVTLETIGDLLTRWPELREAGWLPEDCKGCPTVPLSDLETVLLFLEGACQTIHYWRRRSELEVETQCIGDEAEWIGLYLLNGFNHPALYDGKPVSLMNLQSVIDPLMMRESLGLQVEKPRLQMTEWWRRIIERVETIRSPGWSDLGYYLLNVEYNKQKIIDNRFRRIRRNLKHKALSFLQSNTVVLEAGPKNRRIAVAAVLYKGIDRKERDRLIKRTASTAFGRSGARQAVVIARSLDRSEEELPYSDIALHER